MHSPFLPEGIPKVMYATDQEALVRSVGGYMGTFHVYSEGSMVKEAASACFSKSDLDALKPPKGYFMTHQVGVGAQEWYMHNRNGDGFPKEALVKYHPTFVSDGSMYREHRNNRPELSIGIIKAARYNHDQERTEQVLWGEIEKCAAEYEAALAGDELAFSMSCLVPRDQCNACGNWAKKVANYCPHLKRRMGQYIPELRKYAFAINHQPKFKDMSVVSRPADRIAYSLSYDFHAGEGLAKAASSRGVDRLEMASALGLGPEIPVDMPDAQTLSLLEKLASYEARLAQPQGWSGWEADVVRDILPFAEGTLTKFSSQDFDKLRKLRPAILLHELAKNGCVLDLPEVVSLFEGTPLSEALADSRVSAARKILPQVFGAIKTACCAGHGLPFLRSFTPSDTLDGRYDPNYNNQIDNLLLRAGQSSGSALGGGTRVVSITIITKRACAAPGPVGPEAQDLAILYGIYKLAALRGILQRNPGLAEEPLALLAAGQNR